MVTGSQEVGRSKSLLSQVPVNPRLPAEIRRLYPFQSHFFTIGGQRLHYVDEGCGEPVLLLHGNPTWSFYYRDLIQALAANRRVIAVDHIGCGLSEKPQTYAYTLETHIENLTQLIDHLQLERLTLVVHDWGGAIGFGYAGRHPQRVSRFVITNTAAFAGPAPTRIRLCRTPILGPLLVRGLNGFVRGALRSATCQKGGLPPSVRRGYLLPYRDYRSRVAINRFVRDIPLSSAHPSYKTLADIERSLPVLADKPMLICWGMRDFCFNEHFLNQWEQRFPAARVKRYAQAGHFVLEDARREIIPDIVQFLDANPVQGPDQA